MSTSAPSRANAIATARPMPESPPVTTAFLPSSRPAAPVGLSPWSGFSGIAAVRPGMGQLGAPGFRLLVLARRVLLAVLVVGHGCACLVQCVVWPRRALWCPGTPSLFGQVQAGQSSPASSLFRSRESSAIESPSLPPDPDVEGGLLRRDVERAGERRAELPGTVRT